MSIGPSERKDERRAQQTPVRHGGPAPHRVQRETAAAPEGEDGCPGGEGGCDGVRSAVEDVF